MRQTQLPAPHTLAPHSTRTPVLRPARFTRTAPASQLPARHALARTQPVCPCNPSNFTVSKVAPAFPQVNFQHFPRNSKIFWFPPIQRQPHRAPPHHAVHHAGHHHTTPFTTPDNRCSTLAPRPTSRQPQLTSGAGQSSTCQQGTDAAGRARQS